METKDDTWGLWPPKTQEFFEMKKTRKAGLPTISEYKDVVFSVWFEISPDIVHHHRTVYSVLDWLGDVGGLFDALTLIARVLLSTLTTLIFKLGLFNRLFEVDVKPQTSTQQVRDADVNPALTVRGLKIEDKTARKSSEYLPSITTVQAKVKKAKLTFIEYVLNKLRLCCR